eukprot:scaffold4510_cov183-Amphora_coffeaeformis.AAC.17
MSSTLMCLDCTSTATQNETSERFRPCGRVFGQSDDNDTKSSRSYKHNYNHSSIHHPTSLIRDDSNDLLVCFGTSANVATQAAAASHPFSSFVIVAFGSDLYSPKCGSTTTLCPGC